MASAWTSALFILEFTLFFGYELPLNKLGFLLNFSSFRHPPCFKLPLLIYSLAILTCRLLVVNFNLLPGSGYCTLLYDNVEMPAPPLVALCTKACIRNIQSKSKALPTSFICQANPPKVLLTLATSNTGRYVPYYLELPPPSSSTELNSPLLRSAARMQSSGEILLNGTSLTIS
jgi:hypothetical protein